ncbi:MAG: amidohydrolase family protein [Micropruina glycogenica]
MGPLKIISDGSLGSRTAWTREPYSDRPATPEHPCGQSNYSFDELRELLSRAKDAGLQVALHAIGDRANEVAIDAFAASGARGSIEHAQLITPSDVRRLVQLGVRASVQLAICWTTATSLSGYGRAGIERLSTTHDAERRRRVGAGF